MILPVDNSYFTPHHVDIEARVAAAENGTVRLPPAALERRKVLSG